MVVLFRHASTATSVGLSIAVIENSLIFSSKGSYKSVHTLAFALRNINSGVLPEGEDNLSHASTIIPIHDLGLGTASRLYKDQYSELDSRDEVSNVDMLRSYLCLEPKSNADVAESIRDKIKLSLERSKGDDITNNKRYLPINELEKILSVTTIEALVKDRFTHLGTDISQAIRRRRILGILLYMRQLDYFESFIEEGILDNHLPLVPVDSESEPRVRTSLSDEVNTTLLRNWDDNDLVLFYAFQPMFFVPFFDIQEDRLCSYTLDRRIRLPWLSCELKTRGGNGVVHQVVIHPSHHNFKSTKMPGKSLHFALKEVSTPNKESYQKELSAMERIWAQMQNDKHLIRLLLTIQHGQKCYFLFEWADGNLEEFWEKYKEAPKPTPAKTKWALEQCLGLATAVKRIHGLATFQKQERIEQSMLGRASEYKDYGRHGDIKPNNILWFSSDTKGDENILVLSDFGLTRFHSRRTRSIVPHGHIEGYTWTYRPPEMDMPHQHICQLYDIWSLGCVYLEFCIWWLKGFNAVQEFENERSKGNQPIPNVHEDNYFTITSPNGIREAEVKPVVLEWIRQLQELAATDLFAKPMLDLIKNEMLVVNKDERSPADKVCVAISKAKDTASRVTARCETG
ncbi:kinase-like domain-containing protein [Xylariaceae sp. FL1651]|nr:kinase-like domain-containing protein [Xylariaceae sp. FL1651]